MFSEGSKSQRDGDRTRYPKALISWKIFCKFDLSFFLKSLGWSWANKWQGHQRFKVPEDVIHIVIPYTTWRVFRNGPQVQIFVDAALFGVCGKWLFAAALWGVKYRKQSTKVMLSSHYAVVNYVATKVHECLASCPPLALTLGGLCADMVMSWIILQFASDWWPEYQ